MVSSVLAVTVGLPGSGKTSLCDHITKYFSTRWNIFHVCYDKIINDRKDWQSLDFQWRTERTNVVRCVERLICKLLRHSSNIDGDGVDRELHENFCRTVTENESMDSEKNFVILIDDNMYYRSMRYVYFQVARKYRLGFVQLYFQCSLETALARNAARTSSEIVPEDVIRRMSERLEQPDRFGNEWEKYYQLISTNDDKFQLDDVCSKLQYVLIEAINDIPTPPPDEKVMNEAKARSKLETENSNLHRADLVLRKTVSEIRKSYADRKRHDMNEICARLSVAKTNVVSKLRSKILDANILSHDERELRRLLLDFAGLSNASDGESV